MVTAKKLTSLLPKEEAGHSQTSNGCNSNSHKRIPKYQFLKGVSIYQPLAPDDPQSKQRFLADGRRQRKKRFLALILLS
jgi:hypothetical protein